MINRPDLVTDPAFQSNKSRVSNRDLLLKELQKSINSISSKELLENCEKHAVPIAPVVTIDKVFETEAAKRLILTQQEENGNTSKRVKTAVFEFN